MIYALLLILGFIAFPAITLLLSALAVGSEQSKIPTAYSEQCKRLNHNS